jgi:DNA-binding NarL/FixJ family response regulator
MMRILIVRGHKVARSAVRSILERVTGWKVVAEVDNGKDAVAKAVETRPDVAIIDDSSAEVNSIETIYRIHAWIPKTEILVLTGHHSDDLVAHLREAGARGHMVKSDAKQYLIAAVETVADRKPFFAGRISQEGLPVAHYRDREVALSPRERVIVRLIAEGHSNKEISQVLALSVKTIEGHRAAAMRKLGLKSTAALVRYAVRKGLVTP